MMKMRFTVNFGEVEVEDFSKPLVLVVDKKEFDKFMKHLDAEGKVWRSEVVVYNPNKFDFYDYHEPNGDEEECYELLFRVSEIEAGQYGANPDMIPNFYNKLWDKVIKAWEKYAKCVEKKGQDECEEPLTKPFHRIIFIFDPEVKTLKKMYLEKLLASPGSFIAQRFLVNNPETVIIMIDKE